MSSGEPKISCADHIQCERLRPARSSDSAGAEGLRAAPAPRARGAQSIVHHDLRLANLVGRAPFLGNAAELPLRILRDTPPRARSVRPELSPELEAFLSKSIARSAADRFQSAAEMADALRRLSG